MKRFICSATTAALFAAIVTIGFTPASAMVTVLDLKIYASSSVTKVQNITAIGEAKAPIEANTATSAARHWRGKDSPNTYPSSFLHDGGGPCDTQAGRKVQRRGYHRGFADGGSI